MAFALAASHLDGDEIEIAQLAVPRPESSLLYMLPDARLVSAGLLEGDYVIVERDRALQAGAFALVTVNGELRLVRMRRRGGQILPEGLSDSEAEVEKIGIPTRVIRVLLP
jgi:SOS-response transcriptional repressor LexA